MGRFAVTVGQKRFDEITFIFPMHSCLWDYDVFDVFLSDEIVKKYCILIILLNILDNKQSQQPCILLV